MYDTGNSEPNSLERAATLANKSFDIIFDDAPMMHAIDRDAKLIKVNRQWLDIMGYEAHEVLGRRCMEFCTEVSRLVAVKDTLPLLRRAGAVRGVGYQFVRKDGRVLDAFLDGEVLPQAESDQFAYATIRLSHDQGQWQEAGEIRKVLNNLARLRFDKVKASLELLEKQQTEPALAEVRQSAGGPYPVLSLPEELLGSLLEATQDVSTGLRSLVTQQEHWLETTEEHQLELLTVAKSIDKTLAELAGTAADIVRQ